MCHKYFFNGLNIYLVQKQNMMSHDNWIKKTKGILRLDILIKDIKQEIPTQMRYLQNK